MTESHIIPMPKWFIAIRILQIVFALIVIAMTAFLISNTIGFTFSATAFAIFLGILTLIVVTYDLVAERAAKGAYNMWAILALDIVMVIFWLSAMGSLAALRAAFTIPVTIYKRELIKRYIYAWAGDTYLAILAVAAAVSALEMILFIVSLIMFGSRIHRHRNSNMPNNANGNAEKIELGQQQPVHQQQQQQQQQPAPVYQQQPTYGQQPVQNGFSPVSPVQQPMQPYQSTMTPPPQQYPTPTQSPAPQQYVQQPQHQAPYPVQPPPQGYAEFPAEYHGKA